MRKTAKLLFLAAAFSLLCGCTPIPDLVDSDNSGDSGESDPLKPVVNYHEVGLKDYVILRQDFISRLNAEGGVHDGAVNDSGEFDGDGYVMLHEGNTLTHILQANTTQHYRIVLAARSDTGAAISLETGGRVVGTYYIPQRSPNDDGSFPFEYSEVDCLFFTPGQNNLRFRVVSGDVDIDYILIENSMSAESSCYSVGSACVNPASSLKTASVMKYFSEIYGQSVLTSQNVSPATNAEIDAIYNATGRYPAIRSSEIAYVTLDTDEDKQRVKDETALAVKWCKDGGIQSYTWNWYSPNIRKSVNAGDFNIDIAFDNQNPEDIAMMTDDDIKLLYDNGFMPSEMISLLEDIDKLAEFFKPFDDAGAAVLFQPIPDGDTGLYWWGKTPEDCKKLWTLIFDRLCRYHKIHCLIWVWNGSNMDYYPGSDRVDIIGQGIFEGSSASFAGRLQSVSSILPTRKPMAVSSCDVMPNIDEMFRDNAIWLWTAPSAGEYTLNMNGALSESYNSVAYMKNFYNHKYTIALDELPDFS